MSTRLGGAAPRGRELRAAHGGRADGPPRSTRVRLVAEGGPCDVRSRVCGERVGARAHPRRAELGGCGAVVGCRAGHACAGMEWLSDGASRARPRTGAWAQTSAAHAHVRARAPGNTLGLARLSTRARWSSLLAPPLVAMPRVAPFCAVADARRLPPRRGAYVRSLGTAVPDLDGARCAALTRDLDPASRRAAASWPRAIRGAR